MMLTTVPLPRYALFKDRMDAGTGGKLSAGQHLLASAESGKQALMSQHHLAASYR